MQNTATFFNDIKEDCIDLCSKANILPSVIASIAAYLSNYGTSNIFYKTNNLFLIPADKNWDGWCFSKDSGKMYGNKSECDEMGAILYKAYMEATDSVKDFLMYIKESRRSNNGPSRYTYVFGEPDYKKILNYLAESGFCDDAIHNPNIQYTWPSDMITIIEKNGLYKWDKEMEDIKMSKKPKRITFNEQKKDVEEKKDPEHIYRVRLDWEKPDTQIFASPIYEDAKEEALKHEGYKIYIDDDGELFEDPWAKEDEPTVVSIDVPGVHQVIHPHPGHPVVLNNTLVYSSALDKASFMSLSGTFYFYDNTVVNGRVKITKHQNIVQKDPSMILGYINVNQ